MRITGGPGAAEAGTREGAELSGAAPQTYTSSRKTISVESDRRGPSFRMRV